MLSNRVQYKDNTFRLIEKNDKVTPLKDVKFTDVFAYNGDDDLDQKVSKHGMQKTRMTNMMIQQMLLNEARDNPANYRARRRAFLAGTADAVGQFYAKVAKVLVIAARYNEEDAAAVAAKESEKMKAIILELQNKVLPIDLTKTKHIDRDAV